MFDCFSAAWGSSAAYSASASRVMYAGRVVEQLAARELQRARHPYTQGLLNCLPRLGDASRHPLPTLDRKAEWAA